MLQYKNLTGSVSIDNSVDAQQATATVAGDGVDCRDVDGVTVIFNAGTPASLTAGTNYYELVVQHSDDDTAANYANVGAGDLVGPDGKLAGAVVGTIDAVADGDQAYVCDYVNQKRYVRAVVRLVGASATLYASATIIRHRKQYP